MARPVQYNINVKPMEQPIGFAEAPEGAGGEGFFATK